MKLVIRKLNGRFLVKHANPDTYRSRKVRAFVELSAYTVPFTDKRKDIRRLLYLLGSGILKLAKRDYRDVGVVILRWK
jgi:hypothetical protein